MIAEVVLLLALALALYAFAGYPLLVIARARRRRGPALPQRPADGDAPAMTVVIAARNEAERIGQRLRNLLVECDYPADRLQVVVVDDGSTDGTAAAVRALGDDRVRLLQQPAPAGKAAALNAAMAQVDTPITVFADARQRFERGALLALAAPFDDPAIGAVAGELELLADDDRTVAANGVYWRLERALREAESRLGWAHGASGAIYAIRTALFRPLPAGLLLDDVYTPLQVVRAGQRVVVQRSALAFDRAGEQVDREFRRKLRTLTGNWQLIAAAPWLLDPSRNRLWFAWASHKFSRLLAPWALLLALVASALATHPLAQALFWLQLAGYLVALVAIAAPRPMRRIPMAGTAGSFLTLNAAALLSLPVWLGRRDLGQLWKR